MEMVASVEWVQYTLQQVELTWAHLHKFFKRELFYQINTRYTFLPLCQQNWMMKSVNKQYTILYKDKEYYS